MNGSYSVPIGMRRSPLMACESPSADNRMKRFISAMPSSMCWPLGENSHLYVDGMRSLLKVSRSASRAIDPAAEIGRARDVGRGGDEALSDRRSVAAELVEQRA